MSVCTASKELARPVKKLHCKSGMDIFRFGLGAILNGSSEWSGVWKKRPGGTKLVDVVELAV